MYSFAEIPIPGGCNTRHLALTSFAAALAASAPLSGAKQGQSGERSEIAYDSVPNVLSSPNIYLGEGSAVATNSKATCSCTRGAATRACSSRSERRVRSRDRQGLYGFLFAHSSGSTRTTTFWAVTKGRTWSSSSTRRAASRWSSGRRPEAVEELSNFTDQGRYSGANKPYRSTGRPTFAWDAAGNIFVSDGYGDSRVVKYDKERTLPQIGRRARDQPGQLNLPHTMATDAQATFYIGDRSNARVQVWDNDLNFRPSTTRWAGPGYLHLARPASISLRSNSVPDTATRAPPADR